MLFECVHFAATYQKDKGQGRLWERIQSHVAAMYKYLERSKDYLIAEAKEGSQEQDLGPTITPEAIILILLDRLSRGVFQDGTIDIIEIYEIVVEKLVRPTNCAISLR